MNNTAYAWFVRGAAHAAMCRTSIESVKKADPGAQCIVVTDEANPPWQIPDVLLLNIDPGMPIMLANLEAQIQALSWAWTGNYERITFLDTDTLLLKPLLAFGDIAFTWRAYVGVGEEGEKVEGIAVRMPYNYGVIVARPCLKSFEAFIWLRERIRAMHSQNQQWYGNQLAAAELAGPRPESGGGIDQRCLPWKITNHGKTIQVGKLPCEQYNYTPQKPGEDVTEKYVLHFKGGKRDLMSIYAKRLGLGWYVQERDTDLAMVASL